VFQCVEAEQKSASQTSASTSLQFQKGSSTSVLYTSQNWDLEDELYDEDSFMKLCKTMEKEELQSSKGSYFSFEDMKLFKNVNVFVYFVSRRSEWSRCQWNEYNSFFVALLAVRRNCRFFSLAEEIHLPAVNYR